jgi:hypothetical protein
LPYLGSHAKSVKNAARDVWVITEGKPMRFVLAAALAASVAGAAWAAPVKSVSAVSKTAAITEVAKEYSTAHCWICRPADLK